MGGMQRKVPSKAPFGCISTLISQKTPKKRWFELKMLKFEPKLPYITLHYVGSTLVSSPTSSPRLVLPYITIRYATPDEWCTTLPYFALHRIALSRPTIHCTALPYRALHYVAIRCPMSHYHTLPYVALPYTTCIVG